MDSDETIAATQAQAGPSSLQEPPASVAPVAIGQRIAGKYLVEKVLGQGGMGVVVAARHETLGNQVAIKFLLAEALANAEAVQRFIREAQAVTKLHSEHIARVIDVGTLDSGAPYMVMEYLEGRDLSDVLEHSGPLPIQEAVDAILQAIDALAEAHALGIVHRDLKPANLYVTTKTDGSTSVKVLDFGISKSTQPDQQQRALTSTRSMMGSPLYMSPEQVRSAKSVDTRSDIWSLGVILYELISGEPPFDGENIGGVFAAILTAEIPSLRAKKPEVSVELDAVIASCLCRDVDARSQDVASLAQALAPFASRRTLPIVERVAAVLSRAGRLSIATPPINSGPRSAVAPNSGTSPRSQGTTQASPGSSQTLAGVGSTASRDGGGTKAHPALPAAIGALAVAVVGTGVYFGVVRDSTGGGTSTPAGLVSSTTVTSTASVTAAPSASAPPATSATPVASSSAAAVDSGKATPGKPASTSKPTTTSTRPSKGGLPEGRD